MCTLSVIRTGAGFRVVHNRDEQRSRAPGEPPAWRDGAVFPVDPDAGGTWVAARDDGVVYAILNVNPSAAVDLEAGGAVGAGGAGVAVSRGRVIRDLLGKPADAPLRHPHSAAMRSYRVVRVRPAAAGEDGPVVDMHRSFGDDLTTERWTLGEPVVWVSSGLGDAAVEPRVPLFAEVVGADPTPAAQDRYHRHAWADRPEVSVLMSRADARTTAITTVDVVGGLAEMTYEAVPG